MAFPQPSTLTILMIPDNPPVFVPRGGQFTFTGVLVNETPQNQIIDVWLMLDVPGYGPYGPVNLINGVPLNPNQTLFAPGTTQDIPSFARLGTYGYIAYCGAYPNTVVDQTGFTFTVTAAVDERSGDSWSMSGWFDEGTEVVPEEINLNVNYPNPFNASTVIAYELPFAIDVELIVYNLKGQKVETLVDGAKEAGRHTVIWTAGDYSSGAYFYKLKTGSEELTGRMMLLK